MDKLTPRFPLHISEGIISFLDFEGNYTRGELEMWAELNSYPYLKRRIAKKISLIIFIQCLVHDSTENTIEYFLQDETLELLSRCTNSFFFLTWSSRVTDEDDRWQGLNYERYHLGFYVVDVFNNFGQRHGEHHFEVLYSFEFMRLMKQTQYKPESMYVITQFPRQKYAMRSLFLPPRLLPKAPLVSWEGTDDSGVWMSTSSASRAPGAWVGTSPLRHKLGGFADNIGVLGFTNPPVEFRDFAGNIYLKEGYRCKIKNFWMRLLMVVKIKVTKYEENCFKRSWPQLAHYL